MLSRVVISVLRCDDQKLSNAGMGLWAIPPPPLPPPPLAFLSSPSLLLPATLLLLLLLGRSDSFVAHAGRFAALLAPYGHFRFVAILPLLTAAVLLQAAGQLMAVKDPLQRRTGAQCPVAR